MLRKVGIVVATTAAGLLALSPLAFAGDYGGESGHHHHHHHGGGGEEHNAACYQDNSSKDKADGIHGQAGLVNVQDTTVQVPIQACNNSVIEGVLGILAKHQENSDDHG